MASLARHLSSRRGLAVLLVAGLSAAWWFWPTDERRIAARLHEAADTLSTARAEPDLQRTLRLAGLAAHLAPDIVVESEPGAASVRGRSAVVAVAAQLARAGGGRRFELRDVRVTVDAGGRRATAYAASRVTLEEAVPFAADGVVRVDLEKVDGEWLIARVVPEPDLAR
jgi:hypothetical protein